MTAHAKRNAARAVAVSLVAVALLLIVTGGSASADDPGATLAAQGWWWEAQQLPAPLPAPPNVKAGQLNVQGSPTGKSAYAAVRYAVDPNRTVTTLTLRVDASGDQGGNTAVVLACQTGSAWTPAEAGQWSSAPNFTTACINGQRAADGKSFAFAVGTLQLGSVLDVAIVPGVDPLTKTTSTFSLVFDGPGNDALATAAGSPPPVTAATTAPAGPVVSGGVGSGTPRPSSSGVHLPPVATGIPSKVGETATSPAKQAASQPGLNTALVAAPAKPNNKAAGYVVLALAGAIGVYAIRQDNLMALNGGMLPGAVQEPGGLGRFSQPRQGQPPALQ